MTPPPRQGAHVPASRSPPLGCSKRSSRGRKQSRARRRGDCPTGISATTGCVSLRAPSTPPRQTSSPAPSPSARPDDAPAPPHRLALRRPSRSSSLRAWSPGALPSGRARLRSSLGLLRQRLHLQLHGVRRRERRRRRPLHRRGDDGSRREPTVRTTVGTVTFDFTPPSPTLASVAYFPATTNPLPSVQRAMAGTIVQRLRVRRRVALPVDHPRPRGPARWNGRPFHARARRSGRQRPALRGQRPRGDAGR